MCTLWVCIQLVTPERFLFLTDYFIRNVIKIEESDTLMAKAVSMEKRVGLTYTVMTIWKHLWERLVDYSYLRCPRTASRMTNESWWLNWHKVSNDSLCTSSYWYSIINENLSVSDNFSWEKHQIPVNENLSFTGDGSTYRMATCDLEIHLCIETQLMRQVRARVLHQE